MTGKIARVDFVIKFADLTILFIDDEKRRRKDEERDGKWIRTSTKSAASKRAVGDPRGAPDKIDPLPKIDRGFSLF